MVVERRVTPDRFVEAVDVQADHLLDIASCLNGGAPDQLRFQHLKEGLGHRVVESLSLAGH